jgi:hypothetical protein
MDYVIIVIINLMIGFCIIRWQSTSDGGETGQGLSEQLRIVLHPGERVKDAAEQRHRQLLLLLRRTTVNTLKKTF